MAEEEYIMREQYKQDLLPIVFHLLYHVLHHLRILKSLNMLSPVHFRLIIYFTSSMRIALHLNNCSEVCKKQ